MLLNIILLVSLLHIFLGLVVVRERQTPVNMAFGVFSLLLSVWNVCAYFIIGYHLTIFMKYININGNLIPPVAAYMTMLLVRKEKALGYKRFNIVISVLSLLMVTFVSLSFFIKSFDSIFKSDIYQLYDISYKIITLGTTIVILFYSFKNNKFKYQRRKLGFLLIAFQIVYLPAMVDLIIRYITGEGLGLGNNASLLYIIVMFYGIFKYKLFDVGFAAEKAITYLWLAILFSGLITFFSRIIKDPTMMFFLFIGFNLFIFIYARFIHRALVSLLGSMGARSVITQAEKETMKIHHLNESDEKKIIEFLKLLNAHLSLDVVVYIHGPPLFSPKWSIGETSFRILEEKFKLPDSLETRYDADKDSSELFDQFDHADVIQPLDLGEASKGFLLAVRQGEDISFYYEEAELLKRITEYISQLVLRHLIHNKSEEEKNNRQSALMANQMAHEIKNPIAALWGAAQLLPIDTDESKNAVNIIREESKRISTILDNWRNFSSEIKLHREKTNIEDLIKSVIELLKLQQENEGVKFDFSPNGKIFATIDRDKLKQILINLILNGIQATRSEKTPIISIDLIEKNDFLEICIKDNGRGISTSDLERIKQPFYTTKARGVGLGLSISDKIVKAHMGSLLFESDGHDYTKAIIVLPIGD